MPRNDSLFREVVNVSIDYLGPAGERFVRRQISTHLNKDPEKITPKDLNQLIDWIRLAFALITENKLLVDEFSSRLDALSKSKRT